MIIKGFIKSVIYDKVDFHIFTLKDNTKVKCVKMLDFNIEKNILVEIDGNFVDDPKFGPTFVVDKINKLESKSNLDLLHFIDGIGDKKAEIINNDGGYEIFKTNPFLIFNYFLSKSSTDILTQIQNKKHLFTSNDKNIIAKQMNKEIKGIGTKKILQWMDSFELKEEYNTEKFLQDENLIQYLASDSALKVYEQIKDINEYEKIIKQMLEYGYPEYCVNYFFKDFLLDSISILEGNPYLMLDYGLNFVLCDNIAMNKFNFEPTSEYRIINAVLHIIKQNEKDGNTFMNYDDCIISTSELIGIECVEISKIVFDNLQASEPEFIKKDEKIYRRVIYFTERKLGIMLANKAKYKCNFVDYKVYAQLDKSKLSVTQKEYVKELLKNKISIFTGGPGTGKTTTINELCNCLDFLNKKYLLCAPTGRAAKRITEATKRPASTIHRLLEYKPRGIFGSFSHNEKYPLYADYIIVDEASMLDVYLLNSLMKAVKETTTIIFVGDINQLPSVSMGSVMRDMKNSGIIPVYELTEVFRQSLDSDIVVNAYHVNNNEALENNNKDFEFELISDYSSLEEKLSKETSDFQILCPMRIGEFGTIRMNKLMQKLKIGTIQNNFNVGDKVIQTDNDYNKEVFNGEIGEVIKITNNEVTVKYEFNDPQIITYKSNELYEIDLAYAISIHKSQGSEADYVIMIVDGNEDFLSKELIYTGITRAKKKLKIYSKYPIEFYESLKTSNNRTTTLDLAIRNAYK